VEPAPIGFSAIIELVCTLDDSGDDLQPYDQDLLGV
jgi:hypothetical protein